MQERYIHNWQWKPLLNFKNNLFLFKSKWPVSVYLGITIICFYVAFYSFPYAVISPSQSTNQPASFSFPPPDTTVVKQLYLTDPTQGLDRIDPVATGDLSTATIVLEANSFLPYNVEDQFISQTYNGNTGSQNYTTDWQEFGESNGPASGDVTVVNSARCASGNCFRIGGFAANINNDGAFREANLDGATTATLNFDRRRVLFGSTATVSLEVSENGGSTWTNLVTYTLDVSDSDQIAESFDLTPYIANNTQIRFIGTGSTSLIGDWIYFDNVEITYQVSSDADKTSFTQLPALCSDLVVVGNTPIVVSAYVNVLEGTMPLNPNMTATLKHGATTILVLTNPVYNSGSGLITWTDTIGTDQSIPGGQSIELEISTAELDVKFEIEYDSETKSSKLELPVSTFINIISYEVYDAPYPGGNIITSATGGTTIYPRAIVTDPFGYHDITELYIDLLGSPETVTSVDSSACRKTYEYAWLTPDSTATFSIPATAKEGYENTVTSVKGLSIDLCSPGIGTPVFSFGENSTRCEGIEAITYLATALNTTGITYSLDSISLIAGNSIDPVTGEVTWVAGWSEVSRVTASAAGCNGPVISTHTILVSPSCLPVANDDYITVDQGEAAFLNVLTNDSDVNNDIDTSSLSIVENPSNGQLTILDDGDVIYTPNGAFIGVDSFVYQLCDLATNCDLATVWIIVEENLLDPCSEANKGHTFYIPFPEEELYTAFRGALDCPERLGAQVRSLTTIKTPYPTIFIKYDHWEDGYEDDLNIPIQVTTEIWGDGNLNNGIAPGHPTDILLAGSSIILDNTFDYTPPRNTSIIAYDGKDKLVSSADITVSKIAGDDNAFAFQTAKTSIYDINRYGTSFTIPFGEDLGNEFQYTTLFVRALEDSTMVTIDVNADGIIDANDATGFLNEGEVLFVEGDPESVNQINDIKSGANVIATKRVGLDVLFGGIDCFGTRNVNLLPASFYSNTYYTPVPTLNDNAPSRVYFYNSDEEDIDITWTSNFGSGTVMVPAETTADFLLPNANAGYKFENQGGKSFIAMQVIDSDNDGSAFDWAFSLIGMEQLTDFSSIAWAPGSLDGTRNDNPIWVTPTANTTIYVKNNGDITAGFPFVSPCGRSYDYSVDLNEFDVYQIKDNEDNDQSGTALFTCDSTTFIGIYGEDPSTAEVGVPSIDVGTTMQPLCSDRLILANEDVISTLPDVAINIPILDNDDSFLVTIDPNTISFAGLTQPANGTITLNSDYNVIYTPDPGWQGTETFEYRLCSQEDAFICDIATVTVLVGNCGATPVTVVINGFTYYELVADNGTYNGEPVLANITVDLYNDANANGVIDAPFDTIAQTTSSNVSGLYSFTLRSLGTYIVKINPDDGEHAPAILDTETAHFFAFNTCVNGLYLGATSLLTALDDVSSEVYNNEQIIEVLNNDLGILEPSSLTNTGLLQPQNGTININPDGTITYQPEFEFIGIDSFEYQICSSADPGLCDVGMVYASVTCPVVSGQNIISGTVFLDTNENSVFDIGEPGAAAAEVRMYRDENQDGLLDAGDILLDSVLTLANGEYALFSVTTDFPAFYIVEVDRTTVPGTFFTTDNLETAHFTNNGESDCINNFGVNNCLGSCPPEANDDLASIDMGETTTINVLSNDFDSDGDIDPASVNIPAGGIQATNGIVSIDPMIGTITYTPDPLFNGVDTFEYQVCDQAIPTVNCAIAMVMISVTCPTIPGQNLISGYVFDDTNGNGIFELGEDGGGNVKVRMYQDVNQNGLLDASDFLLDSMLSNADGTYSFAPVLLNPTDTISVDIIDGFDDAEERKSTGRMLNNDDLDLGASFGNSQWVGMRFKSIAIPQGAFIENAYIQFHADSDAGATTNLNIYGENVDDAAALMPNDYNISSRTRTAVIAWNNVPSWTNGNTYVTPLISTIVQTIVDRNNWTSGNDLLIMIEGTGRRSATSFDGGSSLVPRLVIEYATGNVPAYFIMDVDKGTLPIGTTLTTDNIEVTVFPTLGEDDCINNFGYQTCPGGCPPIAMDDQVITEQNTTVFVEVAANDTDENFDLDTTSIRIPSSGIQPDNGSVSIDESTGVVSYTPDNTFIGLDSFEYVICDLSTPTPKCDTALVRVEVVFCNINSDQVKITGQLFIDANNNGIKDDSGSGLPGIAVNLIGDDNCNGTVNGTDGIITTTTTDSMGHYEFLETVGATGFPVCYTIQLDTLTLPAGYRTTTTWSNTASFSAPSTCEKDLEFGVSVFVTAVDDQAGMLTHTGFTDIDVLANDSGNPATSTIVNQPFLGNAIVNGNGTIRFSPDDHSIDATYSFEYQICSIDDPSVCDIALVTVEVSGCLAGPTEKVIRGKVFHDINENENFDLENGIGNVEVSIFEDRNQDGLVDGGDILLSTETTTALGDYVYTFTPASISVEDDFSSGTYTAGTGSWATDWIETDPVGSPGPGGDYVGIINGQLAFHWAFQNDETIRRSVDLSGAASATLSFNWTTIGLDIGESLSIQVSSDGTNFTTIGIFTGNQSNAFTQNISSYISSNTTIRFLNESLNWENGEYTYLDDIIITAVNDISHFVVETAIATHPAGYFLTTDNTETAIILTAGQCDVPNNFGLNFLDNDSDGISDGIDLDDDNDGIPDLLESPADPLTDNDNDGIPVYMDDNDGDPNVDDVDGLVETSFDFDADNIPNHFDLDADGDGCPDTFESGHDQIIAAGDMISGPFGSNGLSGTVESDDTPSATITYNLTESIPGTYDFLSESTTSSCNAGPLAISDINATETGTAVSGNLLTNDQDLNGNPLIINQLPLNVIGGTVIINTNGDYTFTPATGFSGEAGFFYQICDNSSPVLCDTAEVYIDVIDISKPANNQISGMEDHFIIENNISFSSDLISNDSDPEGDSLIVNTLATSSPLFGNLIINSDGTFNYTPTADVTGEDYFTYEVCNNTAIPACDTVTVRMDIIAANGLNNLYATDDASLGNIGDTISGNVSINDNIPAAGIIQVDPDPILAPQNGTVAINPDGDYTYLPNPGFFGNDRFVYQICDLEFPVSCDSATVYLTVLDNRILLSLKVMLQGALFGATDSLMRADLIAQNLVPLEQPYTTAFNPLFETRFKHTIGGTETTTNTVLNANVGTPDGIVDWVFIEFRDPVDTVTVIRTIPALVQRDGDIVDAATGGDLYVKGLFGQLFVIVKHRNHLGAMTATPISIIGKSLTADFTTMTDLNLYHKSIFYDGLEQTSLHGKNALWAGNANADNKIKYDGSFNDRIILAAEIITSPPNIDQNLNYNNAIEYHQGDINMDGKAKYDGSQNDRIILQYILHTYPNNSSYLNNYNLMIEQIR